jgi:protoheme IX farnesyltransferase
LFFYNPLKRKSPLCTLVGAFSDAMPPPDRVGCSIWPAQLRGWILYSVVFLWQFPHFMSIAWMYHEDYARAGYLVLPHDERARARLVSWQTLLPLLVLAPVSLSPALTSKSSAAYCIGTVLLSVGFYTMEPGSPFKNPTPQRDIFLRLRSFTYHHYLCSWSSERLGSF